MASCTGHHQCAHSHRTPRQIALERCFSLALMLRSDCGMLSSSDKNVLLYPAAISDATACRIV
uniref:Uncharacterized protein n=1 Tax=Physcomitrium patens TaxID=3218 RepID=A0A2K1KEX2_PHYPA|nr:hypothetical protein PHYPA_008673 [Physcomitrium patens]